MFCRPARDSVVVKELKKNFAHEKKACHYGKFKIEVDCLILEAAPGVTETIMTDIDSIKKDKEMKFLNLGGGVGQLSPLFGWMGFDVINADIAVECTDKKNIKVDFNNADSLPLPEKNFDVVLCQEVVEHIENPWRLFRLARKYTKDEGLFYLTTPNIHSIRSKKCFTKSNYFEWFRPRNLSYHINPLPFWEIEMIAEKNGYKLVNIRGSGDYYFARNNKSKNKILKNNDILIFKFLAV